MIYLLQHLLGAAAERSPDRPAVRFLDERRTYAELDLEAGKLAAALVDHGVRRGDRVGIWFNKSVRSVSSVFAVLKAGGVYVPLDPLSPASRVASIIADCGITHLITTAQKLESLGGDAPATPASPLTAAFLVEPEATAPSPAPAGVRVVPWADVEARGALPGAPEGVDTDLAYILYTSGSTGVPKGVMISHRAAFTFVDWTHEEFGIGEHDVVWNHAPLHFDLSIFDIFTTVKAGGTVCPVPERLSTFPIRLAEFLRDQHVSVAYCVPTALTMMLLRGNLARLALPDLRLVLFAGEVFPIKYLREVKRVLSARMANLYGPTETNVCTWHDVRDEDVAPGRDVPVPIGRAIPNYDVFAVNERGALAQAGEEGELYARGPGLCSGYWGDPEKTRRLLVRNPLPSPTEELCVRTGDIVIPREDGSYIYVGRRDHMVKSKGYRIELGEVEAAIYAHPLVTEAAIVPVPDDEIGNRLLAFVVTHAPGALTAQDVQRHCGASLPKYMVPESVEFRDALPKTSTGKVDRPQLLREHLSQRPLPGRPR